MPTKDTRKWLFILGGTLYTLVALLIITYVMVPTISQLTFKHYLEQRHLHGSIEHIDMALNTGTLSIINVEIYDGKVQLLKLGKLRVHIKLGDLFDRKLTIKGITLENTHIQITQHNNSLAVAGIKLNPSETPPSNRTIEKPSGTKPWNVQLNKLHIMNLDTCITTNRTRQPLNVCNHLGEFAWNGNINMSTNQARTVKSAGTLSVRNLVIHDEKQNLPLFQFDSLTLSKININGIDKIEVGSLALQKLKMLPNKEVNSKITSTLGIGKLLINTISFNKMKYLNIASINLNDISSYLRLNTDNKITSLKEVGEYRPIKTENNSQNVSNKPNRQPSHILIKVGKINVASTKAFVLEDAHTKPATTQRIKDFSLNLGAIDSSKPEQRSKLSMQFKYGKYGKIKVNGEVQAFAAKPTMDLNANIVGLNLNRVSPYTREFLQHKIKSGELNAKLVIKIKQGKLYSNAKLTLYKFYVNRLPEKETDKYKKSLGIPLSAALSLLRDKNDTIRIELPVTGNIENPDFSLNDVIATVSAKAIKVAIINYYATLGLLNLVTGAFDLITELRFEPLVFIPGQTSLTDKSRKSLDKFASMMSNRPQVHLVVCGHATIEDQFKLFPKTKPSTQSTTSSPPSKIVKLTEKQVKQLNQLALTRSAHVKQYLVEDKGIKADRLIQCNPTYQPGDDQKPYVELHI